MLGDFCWKSKTTNLRFRGSKHGALLGSVPDGSSPALGLGCEGFSVWGLGGFTGFIGLVELGGFIGFRASRYRACGGFRQYDAFKQGGGV